MMQELGWKKGKGVGGRQASSYNSTTKPMRYDHWYHTLGWDRPAAPLKQFPSQYAVTFYEMMIYDASNETKMKGLYYSFY